MGRGPVGEPAIIRYVNNSLAAVTDVSNTDASMILIKTLTASSSSTLSFVDGTSDVVLDSTYPIYKFVWTNVHPSADAAKLQFQGNAAGGSGYNETITSTFFYGVHTENDGTAAVSYDGDNDLAQSTNFQPLIGSIGNGNDESCSGELMLFNPSSTTFVKHFITRTSGYYHGDGNSDSYAAGYFNTTSAIDEIQFKMSSGNIDSGVIKLYGIKDS